MEQKKDITIGKMALLNVISFGLTGYWAFDGAVMPLFLTSKFGLSNTAISLLLMIGKGMILCSVVFGLFSDFTFPKWGKRRPLMLYGGLLSAPLIILLPHAPNVIVLSIMLTFIYFGLQFAAVPYFALIPEVVPNEKLGTANAFFSGIGGIGTVVSYAVLLSIVYKTNKYMAFYIFGVIHFICTLVTVLTIKEYPQEKPEGDANRFVAICKTAKEAAREIPKLKDLLWFLSSNLFFWLSLGAFIVYFTKFMEYYVNIPGTKAGLVLGSVVIISILLAVPVGMLGDKLSRRKLCFAGMAIIFVGLTIGYFVIGPGSTVSAYKLGDIDSVQKFAANGKIDISGADLAAFKNEAFKPEFDVNKDEMFDKKSDVMRWCLNGEINPDVCEKGIAAVIGKDSPAFAATRDAFKRLSADILKQTSGVLTLSYIIIAFTAVGLTTCFIIMAAILPSLMPVGNMGFFMGLYSTVTGGGQLISLGIAGIMIDATLKSGAGAFGYRWIFVQGVVFMAIAALLVLKVPYIPNANQPTISDLAEQKKKL